MILWFNCHHSCKIVKQITELRNVLLNHLRLTQTDHYNKTVEINKLNELSSRHTEEINDLLDLFDVNSKAMYIDEHESNKAHIYLGKMLSEITPVNWNIINGYIIKLGIEECILTESVKPYEEWFSNYEDSCIWSDILIRSFNEQLLTTWFILLYYFILFNWYYYYINKYYLSETLIIIIKFIWILIYVHLF